MVTYKILHANLPLKIFSCIIGYGLWAIYSASLPVTLSQQVPVCFYNISEGFTITGPEYITVTLQAPRYSMISIDTKNLAVHLDAHRFTPGKYPLHLDVQKLFLPSEIKLLSYYPSNAIIEISYNAKQE